MGSVSEQQAEHSVTSWPPRSRNRNELFRPRGDTPDVQHVVDWLSAVCPQAFSPSQILSLGLSLKSLFILLCDLKMIAILGKTNATVIKERDFFLNSLVNKHYSLIFTSLSGTHVQLNAIWCNLFVETVNEVLIQDCFYSFALYTAQKMKGKITHKILTK